MGTLEKAGKFDTLAVAASVIQRDVSKLSLEVIGSTGVLTALHFGLGGVHAR